MPHYLKLFLTVYGVVFVAELPDKTALAALVLATKHKALPVFIGASLALAIQSLVAVVAGQLLTLLPPRPVHIVAGVVFLISGVVMWIRHEESAAKPGDESKMNGFWKSTWVVFGIVFIAEWGDLTQLATGALAARYAAPITVFAGATAALWSVAAIASFVGTKASKLLEGHVVQRIAAAVFGAIGVALVAGLL